ncbi:hypothetical protein NDU88_005764 [Pleurodeles waltl]|uniref:Uncharacterized protein n=1 Tax=Pleurodeles waltl TaxID=8319 RepID=A0AAV7LQ09_PLEWA|nr:hypothetical protein NDU88_005764 [Pleurodeles waltl]
MIRIAGPRSSGDRPARRSPDPGQPRARGQYPSTDRGSWPRKPGRHPIQSQQPKGKAQCPSRGPYARDQSVQWSLPRLRRTGRVFQSPGCSSSRGSHVHQRGPGPALRPEAAATSAFRPQARPASSGQRKDDPRQPGAPLHLPPPPLLIICPEIPEVSALVPFGLLTTFAPQHDRSEDQRHAPGHSRQFRS